MDSTTLGIIGFIVLLLSSIISVIVYFSTSSSKVVETTTPKLQPIEILNRMLVTTTTAEPIITTTEPITTTAEPTTTVPPTTAAPYSIGQSIMCTSNDVGAGKSAIYRYDGNNTLRLYPNPGIAKSWDENFLDYKKINCADLKMGPVMGLGSYTVTVETETPITIVDPITGVITTAITTAPPSTTPDPDYVNVPIQIDTNYANIPNSCLSDVNDGECSELKFDTCYATMKTNGDFVIRKTETDPPTMVWDTNTQSLGLKKAKFILGNDGVLKVMDNNTVYWTSTNSESTNGPFTAHIQKDNGICKISIYDVENNKLYSTPSVK